MSRALLLQNQILAWVVSGDQTLLAILQGSALLSTFVAVRSLLAHELQDCSLVLKYLPLQVIFCVVSIQVLG